MDNVIVLRQTGRVRVIEIESITHLKACGNYTEINLSNRPPILHRESLKSLHSKLPQTVFFRIHKSTVVRLDNIVELKPTINGDMDVLLKTGDKLALSRRFREGFPLVG